MSKLKLLLVYVAQHPISYNCRHAAATPALSAANPESMDGAAAGPTAATVRQGQWLL